MTYALLVVRDNGVGATEHSTALLYFVTLGATRSTVRSSDAVSPT